MHSFMGVLDMIRAKREEILAIAKEHKAEKLWVFGSCARGEETAESDVDFLVKWAPDVSYRDYDSLESSFSSLFQRGVDVISASALERQPFFAYNVKKDLVAV